MHLVSISGMSTFAAHVAVLVVIVGAANHFPWMRQRQACWWWQIGWWGDEFADEPSGTSVGAWWRGRGLGGASNLELQPPTPPHSLPIPHPETPQLNKVPQVTPILIVGLQLWRRKQREKKVWLTRHLESHIKLQYERNGRVRIFFANFWHLSRFFNSIFEPFSSLYNRNHYPGPEVY